jgi:hypothetical protein
MSIRRFSDARVREARVEVHRLLCNVLTVHAFRCDLPKLLERGECAIQLRGGNPQRRAQRARIAACARDRDAAGEASGFANDPLHVGAAGVEIAKHQRQARRANEERSRHGDSLYRRCERGGGRNTFVVAEIRLTLIDDHGTVRHVRRLHQTLRSSPEHGPADAENQHRGNRHPSRPRERTRRLQGQRRGRRG